MISTQGITLRFGGRALFENVSIKFNHGNCYGLIGANGTGKTTFLKILSGELEPNKGEVIITPGDRLAVLKQDHFEFDAYDVLTTVIMGHKRLCEIMQQREALYAKAEFTDEDGIKSAELEGEFAELNGWNAESEAETLLNGLGISSDVHNVKMSELDGSQKVKILLAQALFGNPHILLLDEPTNHLDMESVKWLEEFLLNFENTVIVVSHDRHFLNKVCTHIADIDYGKLTLYVGNYDFWYEYTQLAQRQLKEQNKKTESKMKELQEFIQRFSANASKSKQATSRKKLLDNLSLENFNPSSRRYPFVNFKPDREPGNDILRVENICMTIGDKKILDNVSFSVEANDKIAFVGPDEVAKTTLFKIIMGELEPDSGSFRWGVTITKSYFPKDNSEYFDGVDLSLADWLRQYSKDKYETTIRGWLGRMLFSGEEALKKASVLSGGERVRCILCKMMLSGANLLILDEPTNHLDLESITALNEGMTNYNSIMLFVSHDHQFVQTVANRIMEITPNGIIDRRETFDEYLENPLVKGMKEELYK